MKRNAWIAGLLPVLLLTFVCGCQLFKKEKATEAPPVETAVPAAIAAPVPIIEVVPDAVEEKAPETLVSQEDIEKAAKLFNLLHATDAKKDAIKAAFAAKLAEFEWDLAKYEQIVFDIGRDPASTKVYKELQVYEVK